MRKSKLRRFCAYCCSQPSSTRDQGFGAWAALDWAQCTYRHGELAILQALYCDAAAASFGLRGCGGLDGWSESGCQLHLFCIMSCFRASIRLSGTLKSRSKSSGFVRKSTLRVRTLDRTP
eukprot:scaffold20879_cov197-Skeletonema_marinoi.AAC.5